MINLETLKKPDIKISVKQTFGIDTEMEIDAFWETWSLTCKMPIKVPILMKT